MSNAAGAPVLLFDGVCNLCNGWVDFVLRHDRAHRIRFAALQSPAGEALLRARWLSDIRPDSVAFVEGDRISLRSTAALRMLRMLGFPWSVFAVFLLVPRPLRDAVYDFIARHRYRWFGKREVCRMPAPEERERFL